eukprot:gene1132-1690_t
MRIHPSAPEEASCTPSVPDVSFEVVSPTGGPVQEEREREPPQPSPHPSPSAESDQRENEPSPSSPGVTLSAGASSASAVGQVPETNLLAPLRETIVSISSGAASGDESAPSAAKDLESDTEGRMSGTTQSSEAQVSAEEQPPSANSAGGEAGVPSANSAGGEAGVPSANSAGGEAGVPSANSAGGEAGLPSAASASMPPERSGAEATEKEQLTSGSAGPREVNGQFLSTYIFKVVWVDWVVDLQPIAKNYVRGWFWVDFASAFPFETVCSTLFSVEDENGVMRVNTLLRLLKTMRLLRLLRLARLSRIVARIRSRFHIKFSFITIFKFLLTSLFVGHWIACGWYLVAQIENSQLLTGSNALGTLTDEKHAEKPWWIMDPLHSTFRRYWDLLLGILILYNSIMVPFRIAFEVEATGNIEIGIHEDSPVKQYIISVYHSIMVMSTIGSYILPVTNVERIFSIVSMMIGASVFAYGMTNMCTLIFNLNRNEVVYRSRMDEINDFMKFRGLPEELQHRILEYYEHLHSRNRFFNENEILVDLSSNLQSEVIHCIHRRIINENVFFKGMDREFVSAVIMRLKMVTYMPDDLIIKQGSVGREMHFVVDGIVEIYITLPTGANKVIGNLKTGDYVGEMALVVPDNRRTASVRAVTFCDIYSLSKMDIDDLLQYFPNQHERWIDMVNARKAQLDERATKEAADKRKLEDRLNQRLELLGHGTLKRMTPYREIPSPKEETTLVR